MSFHERIMVHIGDNQRCGGEEGEGIFFWRRGVA